MDETLDDERASAIWRKKNRGAFRPTQLHRSCTARSFHVSSRPLDRCTSSMRRLPFRSFRLCGKSERSLRRRMQRTIPQNHFSRRLLAHRRTRGRKNAGARENAPFYESVPSHRDLWDVPMYRRARRETASPRDGGGGEDDDMI